MSESSERSIFLKALDIESPESRSRYLRGACAGNPQLQASVEALLDAHQLSENLLDHPLAVAGSEIQQITPNRLLTESAGTIIGPYRLMEQIGEGGFGLVFVAQQQHPVHRQVALKLIKPGMDTREVIARFEAERQALAMMEHPNIASVFDAGTTPSGRPYFVMELVRGVPITEFCKRHQLDLRSRLKLFISVCNAVQHAHQKGVIHRDLKPSNVLVTKHDDVPVAKVIDFGVAKALGQSLTDKTIYTRYAAMIGTPLYMSPEQAEFSGLEADTRTDIYSLGVLLYELLTGGTPFERERFETVGIDEVRRIIREEEPPRPSVRLHTNAEAISTVAEHAGYTTTQRAIALRGDLDWIVMKALEKNRERRYESASELAKDVGHYLAAEPVSARPPSKYYLMQKFAARHRGALITFSVVAAALLVATGVSLWAASVAVTERNEKQAALQEAIRLRDEADQARNEIAALASRLKAANLLVTNGRAHVDAQRWAAAHDDFAAAIQTQPNYYNAWMERAALYVKLGLWNQAAQDYARAIELGVPVDSPANWGIPQLFLFNGDATSHREYCLAMLQQAEHQARDPSLPLIRSCVMAKEPVTDADQLAEQALQALEASTQRPPPPPGRRSPFRFPIPGLQPDGPPRSQSRPGSVPAGRAAREVWQPLGASRFTAGIAMLRAQRFQQAARLLELAMEDKRWRGRRIAYPALAIVYHRTGDAELARDAFAKSEQQIESWTESILASPAGEMPIPWFDWIESLLLHREASLLLTGFAPAEDPRLRAIQDRARSLILAADQK